jgi:hypothetical protein
MDWIDMAEARNQWRALVNAVMNLRGSIKCWGVLKLAAQLATSREGLRSMDLVNSTILVLCIRW